MEITDAISGLSVVHGRADSYVLARESLAPYPFLRVSTIGENIRHVRERAGYGRGKQGEFAKQAGVSQTRLSDWENDRFGTPDLKSLLKIAKAGGVSIDTLLAGLDPDYDAQL